MLSDDTTRRIPWSIHVRRWSITKQNVSCPNHPLNCWNIYGSFLYCSVYDDGSFGNVTLEFPLVCNKAITSNTEADMLTIRVVTSLRPDVQLAGVTTDDFTVVVSSPGLTQDILSSLHLTVQRTVSQVKSFVFTSKSFLLECWQLQVPKFFSDSFSEPCRYFWSSGYADRFGCYTVCNELSCRIWRKQHRVPKCNGRYHAFFRKY